MIFYVKLIFVTSLVPNIGLPNMTPIHQQTIFSCRISIPGSFMNKQNYVTNRIVRWTPFIVQINSEMHQF